MARNAAIATSAMIKKLALRQVHFRPPASDPFPSVYSPHAGQRTISTGICFPQ